jgi:pilus assembly protein CpaC
LLPTEKVIGAGSSEIIQCRDAKRVVVGDPYIADVVALSSTEILLNGKSPGSTVLYVWDASGRRTYKIIVKPPELDLSGLCTEIGTEVCDPRISVRVIGSTIVLEGKVSSQSDSSRAESIARAVVEKAACEGTGGITARASASGPPSETAPSSGGTGGSACAVKVVNLIKIERDISEVTPQTVETAEAVRQTLNNTALTVRALPDDLVIVEGRVGTEAELAKIAEVLKGWITEAKGPGAAPGAQQAVTVMNHVQIDTGIARQILVRSQIVDIDRSALKEIGVDWGKVVFKKSDVPGQGPIAIIEDQPFLIGQDQFGPFNLFSGGGPILRFDPIGARVKALENKNKAKVLSEPNLLVLDGKEASMLVGGEIPIPIVQSAQTGTVATVTIQYQEYGVRLNILPHIMSDDNIELKVAPEVSALDYANAVVMSGFVIPALRTRKAETTVNLKSGQSIIIGGLIQNEMSKAVKQIPLLGDIPILGELFKMQTFKNGETELVIIITPEIVKRNSAPCTK